MTHATGLFRTVARSDRLGFGSGETLDGRKVIDFLGFKKPEIAKVAGVAPASVRFDQKMPAEVRERIQEIANVIELVAQFFDGDAAKTALWFKTPNPLLGNLSPRDMIRYGRCDRLRRFVLDALDENAPADAADDPCVAPASRDSVRTVDSRAGGEIRGGRPGSTPCEAREPVA